MKLLVIFLILAALPVAHAQGGLFVSLHNVTYTLGESDFAVEEVIVFENAGAASGNIFRDNVYLTRGDARDVEIEVVGKVEHSVEYSPSTVININLLLWRGEKREVVIKYRRSDMLFREDMVRVISGLALGKYPWITDRGTIKFIAPKNYQFGNVTPYVTKTFEGGREILVYDISPIDIENLIAIKEGLPVRIEYAKYDEMTLSEIKTAEEFLEEAESDLSNANKSIENAMRQSSNITQVLMLFAAAGDMLDESKNVLDLAEIKSNPYSAEYGPYEAYRYAIESKSLAKNASRKAKESKDLANYEIQRVLEERISGIGSKLSEQAEGSGVALVPVPTKLPEVSGTGLLIGYGIVVMILAALTIFGLYRGRGTLSTKRSKVKDFKAIDELKHKTFTGFDKKLGDVKYGTELAAEIRDLRRKKEKLEFDVEKLQRKKAIEGISDHLFEMEKEKLDKQINETVANIDKLQIRLQEIKKAKK